MVEKGTGVYVPRRLAEWIRQEASRRGMKIAKYLALVTACPDDFQEKQPPRETAGRPRGEGGGYRQRLRDLILEVLAEQPDQEADAGFVLKEVKKRAAKIKGLPEEWLKPSRIGNYETKVELFTAFERKNAKTQGMLAPSDRGTWRLSAAGIAEAKKIAAPNRK